MVLVEDRHLNIVFIMVLPNIFSKLADHAMYAHRNVMYCIGMLQGDLNYANERIGIRKIFNNGTHFILVYANSRHNLYHT